jgi:hypothetical protein
MRWSLGQTNLFSFYLRYFWKVCNKSQGYFCVKCKKSPKSTHPILCRGWGSSGSFQQQAVVMVKKYSFLAFFIIMAIWLLKGGSGSANTTCASIFLFVENSQPTYSTVPTRKNPATTHDKDWTSYVKWDQLI